VQAKSGGHSYAYVALLEHCDMALTRAETLALGAKTAPL
jgi:hypothetical protein